MSSVLKAVTAELAVLGATDCSGGQVCLALARELDESRNGMAMQGNARALTELLVAVRAAYSVKVDTVDELKSKRDAAIAAAG